MKEFLNSAFDSILPARERAARLDGKLLGSYRLLEKLTHGEGGFGVVYRAVHTDSDPGEQHLFAVKVLGIDLRETPELREGFRREINILRAISTSPGVQRVVKIYDWGIYEETLPWIALQYIEGQPLDQWIEAKGRETPIAARDIACILSDVLEGLESIQAAYPAAESNGLRSVESSRGRFVHRDIKPGNVMIRDEEGRPRAWLIDFGISMVFPAQCDPVPAATMGAPVLTQRALTVQYASPEMLVAGSKEDARSDVFQVGLLGFELLTHLRYWEVWPDSDRPLRGRGKPWWLRRVIRRALSWDRGRRFATAMQFQHALEHPIRDSLYSNLLLRHWRVRIGLTALILLLLASFQSTLRTMSLHDQNLHLGSSVKALNDKVIQQQQQIDNLIGTGSDGFTQLNRLRELHRKISEGRASSGDLQDTSDAARRFLSAYPNHWSAEHVKTLQRWLASARGGTVRITILALQENRFSDKWEMTYTVRISSEPKPPLQNNKTTTVTDSEKVDEWIDAPWTPESRIEIFLEVQGRKYQAEVKIDFGDARIIRDKSGLDRELVANGGDFKLWYRIERRGFHALPDFPQ